MSKSKTIHELFALQEEEYKITIVSYVDLWDEKYNDLLRLALEKYDLREIEFVKRESLSKHPPQFPTLQYGVLYYIEATIGTMPRGMYEQLKLEISQTTRVRAAALFVSEDGNIPTMTTSEHDDEALLSTAMGEHEHDKMRMPDFDVQELVGQKSVMSLMKALEEEEKLKDKEVKDTFESKVYRTTHTVLKEHTGTSFSKGLYEFRIVNGEVVLEGRNDSSDATPLPTFEQLEKELKNSIPSLAQKYGLDK